MQLKFKQDALDQKVCEFPQNSSGQNNLSAICIILYRGGLRLARAHRYTCHGDRRKCIQQPAAGAGGEGGGDTAFSSRRDRNYELRHSWQPLNIKCSPAYQAYTRGCSGRLVKKSYAPDDLSAALIRYLLFFFYSLPPSPCFCPPRRAMRAVLRVVFFGLPLPPFFYLHAKSAVDSFRIIHEASELIGYISLL